MTGAILALDTSGEFGSIALLAGDQVSEVAVQSPDGFSHVLFEKIERLLSAAGIALSEVECFAAASGPGAFTGLRVGLAAVKGLAWATDRKAIGVSNLRAIASFGSQRLRAAILDARRGEIYAAVYDDQGDCVSPEVVVDARTWLSNVEAPVEFLGPGIDVFRSAIADYAHRESIVTPVPRSIAAAVARIARADLERGSSGDPVLLDANYVRRSDAELLWKE